MKLPYDRHLGLLACALLAYLCSPGLAQAQSEDTPDACQDGLDNDSDSFVDCADQDCSFFTFCDSETATQPPPVAPPPAPPPVPQTAPENTLQGCMDNVDNDLDDYVDCYDQDCAIFAHCAKPPPGVQGPAASYPPEYEAPALPKTPRKSKGGIGIHLIIMPVSHASRTFTLEGDSDEDKVKTRFDPAAGIGLFGEKLVNRYIAIGAQIYLIFPNVDRIKHYDTFWEEWGSWGRCSDCERNITFAAMFRLKFPIPAGKWVGIYPLVGFGIGNHTMREKDVETLNYFGMTWSGGLGAEFYTPAPVTPFLEITYMGGVGWLTDKEVEVGSLTIEVESEVGFMNSMLLNLGLRFL